jgi:hypothetical protein
MTHFAGRPHAACERVFGGKPPVPYPGPRASPLAPDADTWHSEPTSNQVADGVCVRQSATGIPLELVGLLTPTS